jgi:hypothetical protein
MDFDSIKFPLAGIVQRQVHFSDEQHHYAFSFASPFIYQEPQKYKEKNAFLIGKFDPFNMTDKGPEEVYAYFVVDKNKAPYLNRKLNLNQKMITLYNGNDEVLGKMSVLSPRSRLMRFSPQFPNVLYNAEDQPVGFCHFQPKLQRKCVYALTPAFNELTQEVTQDSIRELENIGAIRCIFTYDLLRIETDFRKRLETLFSAEKKSEQVRNRIMMIQKPEDDKKALFYLTAIVAFFWDTMIEFPLAEN